MCLLKAQVPHTDLYIFQLTQDSDLQWHIHSPKLASAWNAGGYTNQPEWINTHTLLVSALRNGESQNEIWLLDIENELMRQMTESPESEFSPTVVPGGSHFSVVRQVHGEEMDQQIYRIPFDHQHAAEAVLPNVRNVGYHAWLSPQDLALFLVEDPVKLALISLADRVTRPYSSGIGRCLRVTHDGQLAYVHKYTGSFWYLKLLDPETRRSEIITETLPGSEDFTMTDDGYYFMGHDTTLYVFHSVHTGGRWVKVFDLGIWGLHKITRLAVSADLKIAIVDQQ